MFASNGGSGNAKNDWADHKAAIEKAKANKNIAGLGQAITDAYNYLNEKSGKSKSKAKHKDRLSYLAKLKQEYKIGESVVSIANAAGVKPAVAVKPEVLEPVKLDKILPPLAVSIASPNMPRRELSVDPEASPLGEIVFVAPSAPSTEAVGAGSALVLRRLSNSSAVNSASVAGEVQSQSTDAPQTDAVKLKSDVALSTGEIKSKSNSTSQLLVQPVASDSYTGTTAEVAHPATQNTVAITKSGSGFWAFCPPFCRSADADVAPAPSPKVR